MKGARRKPTQRPAFFEGVVVALAASVFAAAICFVLSTFLPLSLVLRATTSVLALAYVVYLLSRSPERVGRLSVIALWAAVSAGAVLLDLTFVAYVTVHLGLIWLVRSLYFYSSVISSLADLCLTGLGMAVAVWAAMQTGSVFITVWCLFLVLALFCAIPPDMHRQSARTASSANTHDRFNRAHRSAEAAVRKLSANR
ncbi:MAG: hypothetical protein ACR2RL_27295 [Gammaproteobacteria bacterium]